MRVWWGTMLALAAGLLAVGCQPAGQAQREAGQAFLLADEPGGAQGVLATKTALEAEPSEPAGEVVVVGRIGGAEGFIWDPDRAAFTLVDETVAAGEHGHGGSGHTSDGCPFCREKEKKTALATALVQMVDDRGEVPPVDARELLGLAEGQTIVVVGQAAVDTLGHLDIRARRLYIRP